MEPGAIPCGAAGQEAGNALAAQVGVRSDPWRAALMSPWKEGGGRALCLARIIYLSLKLKKIEAACTNSA